MSLIWLLRFHIAIIWSCSGNDMSMRVLKWNIAHLSKPWSTECIYLHARSVATISVPLYPYKPHRACPKALTSQVQCLEGRFSQAAKSSYWSLVRYGQLCMERRWAQPFITNNKCIWGTRYPTTFHWVMKARNLVDSSSGGERKAHCEVKNNSVQACSISTLLYGIETWKKQLSCVAICRRRSRSFDDLTFHTCIHL